MKKHYKRDTVSCCNISKHGNLSKREYCISVRLNNKDLEILNVNRGSYKKANGSAWLCFINYPPLFLRSASKHGELYMNMTYRKS